MEGVNIKKESLFFYNYDMIYELLTKSFHGLFVLLKMYWSHHGHFKMF